MLSYEELCMNDEYKLKLLSYRVLVSGLRYVPPFLVGKLNLNRDELVVAMRGKHLEVDDKDNGYLPDLTGANFNNEGEPTFFLYALEYRTLNIRLGTVPECEYTSRYGKMQDRCLTVTDKDYSNYGGRGIRVCDAWHRMNPYSRRNYYNWINKELSMTPLSDTFEVDRENNDGHYSPYNCRLVTREVNSRNKRSTRLDEEIVKALRSEYLTLHRGDVTEWYVSKSKELNVKPTSIQHAVLRNTWSDSEDTMSHNERKVAKAKSLLDEFMKMRSEGSDETLRAYAKRVANLHGIGDRGLYKQLTHIAPPEAFRDTRVIIDNVTYRTLTEASKVLHMCKSTISDRICNSEYPNYSRFKTA